jgi:hypothetical protein
MALGRRNFLLGAFASIFGAGKTQAKAVATGMTAARAAYGEGVRKQVFEVIVRQAMAGAPWKEICAGPMKVNNIAVAEVQAEVARREHLAKQHPVSEGERAANMQWCPDCAPHVAEQLIADHPNHAEQSEKAYCPVCRDETITFAQEKTASHGTHTEYAIACEPCWKEFLEGKRSHPKFGMVKPKTDT